MELIEDVLGVVVEFVGMRGATAVRATCKQLRDVAARVAWRTHSVRVQSCRLRLWRACFPRAQVVAVRSAKDEDLQWVEGVLDVELGGPVLLHQHHGPGPAAPGERDHSEPAGLRPDHGRGPAAPGERDHSEPDVLQQDHGRGAEAPRARDDAESLELL